MTEERGAFLPKNGPPVNAELLEAERERPMHDFPVSTAPMQNIDGIITAKFEM